MKVKIEAVCPDCRKVLLDGAEFKLYLCTDSTELSYYSFACPACGRHVTGPARKRQIEILVAERADVWCWSLPAEIREPHHGAALCSDDLIDLHQLLESNHWWSDLEKFQVSGS